MASSTVVAVLARRRQLVVVLPLPVVVVLWWLQQLRWPARAVAAGLGLAGVATYGWLLADGWAQEITWVSGSQGVSAPVYRALRPLLPDYTEPGYWPAHLALAAVLLALAAGGWWFRTRRPRQAYAADPAAIAVSDLPFAAYLDR